MAGKTIEDVKKNKITLETQLKDLLVAFENDNGIKVRYFNINRERICDCERPVPCGCVNEVKSTKPGEIKDVGVEVDLDLLF